jgi:hypothetical protein
MKIGKNLGTYLKTALAATTLVGGMAACELANPRASGEGIISDIYNKNGYQIVEMTIRRNAGDSLEPPPWFMESMTDPSVPIPVVFATKKPIENAHVGDRLNFKYKYDRDRNAFEESISGYTRPKWCQVKPKG